MQQQYNNSIWFELNNYIDCLLSAYCLRGLLQAMSMGMQQNQSASDMRELALAMAAASAEVSSVRYAPSPYCYL